MSYREGPQRWDDGVVGVVVVAGRDELVRHRLAGLLSADGFHVGDDCAVVAASGRPRPWVYVLVADIRDEAGLRRVRTLGDRRDAMVVAISPAADRSDVARALAAGVRGIVLEHLLDDSLATTVRAVRAGQVAFPHDCFPAPRPNFSYREKQVLALVIMRFSNSEIAAELHLAEGTVRKHMTSALRKLGVRSRTEAAELVLDPHGGLGPDSLSITADERDAGRLGRSRRSRGPIVGDGSGARP